MAVRINGKVIRNIPEQVGKNKKDIKTNVADLQALAAQIEAVNQKVNDLAAGVYKPQGDATIAELNALTVTEDMNGYVYNVTDSGTLTKGSVSVNAGDNVVIIWSAGDWAWDKLSGIIDLSAYYTKTESDNKFVDFSTAQNITGKKTLINTLELKNTESSNPMSLTATAYSGLDFKINNSSKFLIESGMIYTRTHLSTTASNCDLGSSSYKWRDLYLSGSAIFANGSYSNSINTDSSGNLLFNRGVYTVASVSGSEFRIFDKHLLPTDSNSTYSIGSATASWKDLYLSGNIVIKGSDNLTATLRYQNGGYLRTQYFQVESLLLPVANEGGNLGIAAQKWGAAYIKNLNLTGNLTNGTDSATVKQISDLVAYAIAQGWIS